MKPFSRLSSPQPEPAWRLFLRMDTTIDSRRRAAHLAKRWPDRCRITEPVKVHIDEQRPRSLVATRARCLPRNKATRRTRDAGSYSADRIVGFC